MFTPPAQLNVFDFLFNRGGILPPPALELEVTVSATIASIYSTGAMLFHWGFNYSSRTFTIKLHQLSKRVELFLLCLPREARPAPYSAELLHWGACLTGQLPTLSYKLVAIRCRLALFLKMRVFLFYSHLM